MIKKIGISEKDKKELKSVSVDPATQVDDFFDYKGVMIKKPWGYEYMIFQNQDVAVWVLSMKQGCKTSMHCHPNKKTSLTVLAGEVKSLTLNSEFVVCAGQGILIDKGVFHCTEAMTPEKVMVMEVETPTNKQDLVRLHDAYGRRGKRYEGQENHGECHKSLIDFHCEDGRFNCTKRFGDCEVSLTKFEDKEELESLFEKHKSDLFCLARGNICDSQGKNILSVGDLIWFEDLKKQKGLYFDGEIEALLVKKIT